jgi:hypothetical protein
MRHEKIIKRPSGVQNKIEVSVYVDNFTDNAPHYNVFVWWRPKGKIVWLRAEIDQLATGEEIHQAKLELWEKLKPTPVL